MDLDVFHAGRDGVGGDGVIHGGHDGFLDELVIESRSTRCSRPPDPSPGAGGRPRSWRQALAAQPEELAHQSLRTRTGVDEVARALGSSRPIRPGTPAPRPRRSPRVLVDGVARSSGPHAGRARSGPRRCTAWPRRLRREAEGRSVTQTVTFSPMAPASSIRARARSRSGADHAPLSGSRVYGQNGS